MNEASEWSFSRITAQESRLLRQRVLRPHQRAEDIVLPGDDAPETWHVGAYCNGILAGIVSLYRARSPRHPELDTAWQMRMMGVAPAFQRQGLARAILLYGFGVTRRQGGVLVWGNARLHVAPLYERLGFVRHGDAFEVPDIGPHVYMERALQGDPASSLETHERT